MLTEEEIDELVNAESQKGNHFIPSEFARAIEAKVLGKLHEQLALKESEIKNLKYYFSNVMETSYPGETK